MVKKLDDVAVAKMAIASSPDVTPGEETAPRTATKAVKAVAEAPQISPEELEREASRGRVFAGGLRRVYQQSTKDDFTDDQVSAAAELGQLMFGSLREAQAPRWLHGVILGSVLVLPFVPLIFKMMRPEPKPPTRGEGV